MEELSISFWNEADHLLSQNTGHRVVNIFEFIESQSNLDCKGIIYFVQSSFEYFRSWRLYNMGNPFQYLTLFMGKVNFFTAGQNFLLQPVTVAHCCSARRLEDGRVTPYCLCLAKYLSASPEY